MGSKERQNFSRLIQDLLANKSQYDVFYAAYLCEQIFRKSSPANEKGFRLEERLSFQPRADNVYPPSDIYDFSFENNKANFVLTFLGLYGIDSPLPRCYHEWIAAQRYSYPTEPSPLKDFLDLFNNRLYFLHYLAWKKYRYYLHFSDGAASERIFAFSGISRPVNQSKFTSFKFRLLQLSGILCNRVRSKAGLLVMLAEFFPGLQFKIREFVPTLVALVNQPRLGKARKEGGLQLGGSAVLGRFVVDYVSRFCLEIGLLDFDDYLEFFPGGKKNLLLNQLLQLYLNDALEYDVQLIVDSSFLKKVSWSDRRIRMGMSFWIGQPQEKTMSTYIKYEEFAGAYLN